MTTHECKCFGGGERCRKWKNLDFLEQVLPQSRISCWLQYNSLKECKLFHEVFGCYTDKHHKKRIGEVTLHCLQEHLDNTEYDGSKMNKQTVSCPTDWPEGVIMTDCITHSYLNNWYAWKISQVISLVLIFICIYIEKVFTVFLSAHMYSLCVCVYICMQT